MSRVALKDHIRETHLFTTRAAVVLVIVGLMLLVIVARMVYLQVVAHEHYITLSQNNRISIVPVAPTRGLIYDRNGIILAQNLPAYSLDVVPERVKDMEATLAALSELVAVTDEEVARFRERLTQKRRFQPTPLKLRLSDEEVARRWISLSSTQATDLPAREDGDTDSIVVT